MAATAKPKITPQFITLDDAGIRTGVHPRTIRRAIAKGELPGYKLAAKALRIRIDDLDAWVESKLMPNARSIA